jgi:hypothetical protein
VDWTTNVAVHESVSPEQIRRRILEALKNRTVDPFLLYSGLRQTSLWIALHQSVSPARINDQISALYQNAFAGLSTHANPLHIVSLGCGDGSKDLQCLQACRSQGKTVLYTPCDISLEMGMTAHHLATKNLPGLQCTPVLCDLLECSTFPGILKSLDPAGIERVVLFLGTIHNYDPEEALKAMLPITRSSDHLILSANLAPEQDYDGHLKRILEQYDNLPSNRWLWGALNQLGIAHEDGGLTISLQNGRSSEPYKQIEARFIAERNITLEVLGEKFNMAAGETLLVFTSRRFTAPHIRHYIKKAGLAVNAEWISDEEGVWHCRRKAV